MSSVSQWLRQACPRKISALACLLIAFLNAHAFAQAPIRVACVGDSITHGGSNPDSARNTWPQILGRLLDETHPGAYRTANFGVPGASAFRGGNRPIWDEPAFTASQSWAPDIVILNLGTNDARDANWGPNGPMFESDYRDLIEVYRNLPSSPEVYVTTLPFLPEWFRYFDEVTPRRPLIVGTITRLADELGLGVIDFLGATESDPLFVADGIHTGTRGNERLAQWTYRALVGQAAPSDRSLQYEAVGDNLQTFVAAGQAVGLPLGSWTQEAEWIEGTPLAGSLSAPIAFGRDDFHVRLRLRMLNQTASNAHLSFNGYQFGFESARNTVYRDGPGSNDSQFLFPSDYLWTSGDWIDAELIRNDGFLWFVINGQNCVYVPIDQPLQSLVLEPGASTMQVESWSIARSPRNLTAAPILGRTVDTPWVDLSARTDLLTVLDRKPDPALPPATLVTAPSGGLDVDIQVLPHEQIEDARRAYVRKSADGGQTWSPPSRLPRALDGLTHRAAYLDDGRLAVAFWDRGEGSPTFGDLVLWIGTFDELLATREGLYTCRLTSGWTTPRVHPLFDPFLGMDASVPGQLTVSAFAYEPNERRLATLSVRVPIAELDALVPALEVATQTVDAPSPDLAPMSVGTLLPPLAVSTVSAGDGSVMLAAFLQPDTGNTVGIRRSLDAGATWTVSTSMPVGNVADGRVSLHAVPRPGTGSGERVLLVTGGYPVRVSVTDDEGTTWSPLQPVGPWGATGSFGAVVVAANGDLVAAFHDDGNYLDAAPSPSTPSRSCLYTTHSTDNGSSWSTPAPIWSSDELLLIEPTLIPSVGGDTIAMVAADGSGRRGSFVLFSHDGGFHWSSPRELPAELDGVGHSSSMTDAGELVITLRADEPAATAIDQPESGTWLAWLGSFDDLVLGHPGEGRVVIGRNGAPDADPTTTLVSLTGGDLYSAAVGAWNGATAEAAAGYRFNVGELRSALEAAPRRTEVFRSARGAGTSAAHSYRTPTLAVAPSGMLIAAADARRDRGDEIPGAIDLVLKRSGSGGAAFGVERLIYADTTTFGVSQPVLSVDPLTGALTCAAMQSFGASLADSAPGFGVTSLRNVITKSFNEGLGWTPPSDITSSVKDAFWAAAWFHAGTGLHTTGGRWLLPMEGYGFGALPCVHLAFSDDAGASWSRFAPIASDAMDPTVAERADGTLVASLRSLGAPAKRSMFVSADGGVTWTAGASVIDPVDDRSPSGFTVLPASATPTGDAWWVLVGPSALESPVREDLTAFVSRDEGLTWSTGFVLHRGPAGDAVPALLPSGELGILAEVGEGSPFERIELIRVDLDVLVD